MQQILLMTLKIKIILNGIYCKIKKELRLKIIPIIHLSRKKKD